MNPVLRSLVVAATLAVCVLPGCAGQPVSPAYALESVPAADALKLQRVVMLMRHGVRPPTRNPVVPAGMNDRPWPEWSVDYGQLTRHGHDAIRLLGQWDRGNWVERGLLPAVGCPTSSDVQLAASWKPRTQDTARALVEGLAPDCSLEIDFPATADEDVDFHPLESRAVPIDADEALRAVQALAPAGGMAGEVIAHAERLALLDRALGCTGSRAQSGCSLAAMSPAIVRNENDRPDVGAAFSIASTVSQTFLLEYLEGMPMSDVAWGRLNRRQIEDLLVLNTLKFNYEGRAPYVAARAASPLASRMLEAMLRGPRLTLLVGHDTNIADLGGLLDVHWKVPSYPRDNPPPGSALGFEVLVDAQGERFVRAFYRSQTMDQVRELQPLSAANAPSYEYLPIPGCTSLCPLTEFERMVREKLVEKL